MTDINWKLLHVSEDLSLGQMNGENFGEYAAELDIGDQIAQRWLDYIIELCEDRDMPVSIEQTALHGMVYGRADYTYSAEIAELLRAIQRKAYFHIMEYDVPEMIEAARVESLERAAMAEAE